MSDITNEEAKEGLESIGMWMDLRYNSRFEESPIQTWDMPSKEKDFFTAYAMNLVMDSDGFESLARQESVDVQRFIALLKQLGAEQTAGFVQDTLTTFRSQMPADKFEPTSKYYDLFEREEVWLKLLEHLGQDTYASYVLRAEAIEAAGRNIFSPGEWQGELTSKRWWQFWK